MSVRRGYTLLEVLVVLVIIGIAVALAQIHFSRSPAQSLADEAHRLARILELARDEAMTQGCTIAWVSRGDWHRIECRPARAAYTPHAWPRGVAPARPVERGSVAAWRELTPICRSATTIRLLWC